MVARDQSVVAAAVEDSINFLFPFWTKGFDELSVPGLPIVPRHIFQLMAGLVELDRLASEIQQRWNQSARIGFVTPEHQRHGCIAAFSLVQLVVLIAGAVMDAVAVHQRKILNDELPPGIVDVVLRHCDLHPALQKAVPSLRTEFSLLLIV